MQDLAAFDQKWFDKTVEIEAPAGLVFDHLLVVLKEKGIEEGTLLAAASMTPAKDLAIKTVNALQRECD